MKRLIHLDQNGTVEGVWFPNARRVVTKPPGVEQAAKGSVVWANGIGEVLDRFSRGNVGSRDAKMPAERAGCRRRHRSQTLSCNGVDRVKVRQERASR